MPLLGRLAAAGSKIRLITGVLLMPLHNPVDIAEQTIALDQISNGRFILGLGLGYREKELEIVGSNRSERVGRLEESIELMKMLWSGEEVTYRGRYFRATGAQMGIRPVHSPRPPIWLACQGRRAASRAARIADACLVGPYVSWADHESLATIYWEELQHKGKESGRGSMPLTVVSASPQTVSRRSELRKKRRRQRRRSTEAGECRSAPPWTSAWTSCATSKTGP